MDNCVLLFLKKILNYSLIHDSSLKDVGPKLLILRFNFFLRFERFKKLSDLKNYPGTLQISKTHNRLLNSNYLQKSQGTIFLTDILMISQNIVFNQASFVLEYLACQVIISQRKWPGSLHIILIFLR